MLVPDAARIAGLQAALQELVSNSATYVGPCFRCLRPKYANNRDAFSGEGSRHSSGRFHSRGAFLIVYTGCTLRVAEWETLHTARNSGFRKEDLLPLTTISAEVKLSRVLDLTDRQVRRALGVTLADLRLPSWSSAQLETLSQIIGRLAHGSGFEAILVPSAGLGDNLNILPDNLQPGSFIRIINEQDLPPPPHSWRASGTEKLVRVMVEGEDPEETEAIARELAALIEKKFGAEAWEGVQ